MCLVVCLLWQFFVLVTTLKKKNYSKLNIKNSVSMTFSETDRFLSFFLSFFNIGQYLGEDLQFSEQANGAVGGSVVFAPDKPPSTSIDIIQWHFGTTLIVTALSDSTTIVPAYRDRVSFDRNALALELRNLRLDDSGIYKLTVIPTAGETLTGETSLQVFSECVEKKKTYLPFTIDYGPNR